MYPYSMVTKLLLSEGMAVTFKSASDSNTSCDFRLLILISHLRVASTLPSNHQRHKLNHIN
jgi:hypothetical protein